MLKIEGLGDGEAIDRKANVPEKIFVITQLASGVRDPNRVNVYIDNHFAFSLDIAQVVSLHVKVGQKIDTDGLKELQRASEFGKLYQRALEWALTRPHSLRETRFYLKQRQIRRSQTNKKRAREDLKPLPEIQNEAIELVVERLLDKGYIDDQKFAEYYVENRFIKKGVSRKRLQAELHMKGIAEDIIESVLQNTLRDEQSEIMKMIAKKYRKYDHQKLLQYLVRQGFNYEDATAALKEYVAKMGSST